VVVDESCVGSTATNSTTSSIARGTVPGGVIRASTLALVPGSTVTRLAESRQSLDALELRRRRIVAGTFPRFRTT